MGGWVLAMPCVSVSLPRARASSACALTAAVQPVGGRVGSPALAVYSVLPKIALAVAVLVGPPKNKQYLRPMIRIG